MTRDRKTFSSRPSATAADRPLGAAPVGGLLSPPASVFHGKCNVVSAEAHEAVIHNKIKRPFFMSGRDCSYQKSHAVAKKEKSRASKLLFERANRSCPP